MNEPRNWGSNIFTEKPKSISGKDLIGVYYLTAEIQPEITEIAAILKDNRDVDNATIDRITTAIQTKINEKSTSRIGEKITRKDVIDYITELQNVGHSL